MKREKQTLILCKQPIKIFCVIERNILQTVLLSFFFVFIFSVPSKVIIIVIQFMFLGINIFWGPLRSHFNPHLMAQAEMSLGLTLNIFMPGNTNLLFYQMQKALHTLSSISKLDGFIFLTQSLVAVHDNHLFFFNNQFNIVQSADISTTLIFKI